MSPSPPKPPETRENTPRKERSSREKRGEREDNRRPKSVLVEKKLNAGVQSGGRGKWIGMKGEGECYLGRNYLQGGEKKWGKKESAEKRSSGRRKK